MTKKDVGMMLATMSTFFPNYKPSASVEDTKNAWLSILGDYDAALVFKALKMYVTTDTTGFAPTPGQLITKMKEGDLFADELAASEVWKQVRRAISRSAYYSGEEFEKLPDIAKRILGSPARLRAYATDQNYNESAVCNNFLREYTRLSNGEHITARGKVAGELPVPENFRIGGN